MAAQGHMAALAAAAAAEQPAPRRSPALFSIAELEDCRGDFNLLQLFVRHDLLLPLNHPCLTCGTHHHRHADEAYSDGYRLQCSRGCGNFSPRRGSFFADFTTPLRELARLLLYFDARLTVTQAEHLSRVHHNTVIKLWKHIRARCRQFVDDNPIRYSDAEIVEIDEAYLKCMRVEGEEEEKTSWPPLLGMISRQTGAVVLDTPRSKAERDIRPAVDAHLSPNTPVVTNGAGYYNYLGYYRDHAVTRKQHGAGGAAWPEAGQTAELGGRTQPAHTNTIEGYWAQFRAMLHASRGWPADYLPLVLAECMFRSLHRSLADALRPL